ncbi:hypothetical protein CHOED_091 [Vibrio phage CHOED]|uniref:hypothetical protein n=1 Tax=Vibrio phage CHOED TaxID=1458716 RepID=UPI00042E24CC|nr:hypothetical protein CHOED_091 [Vibrio phage CHOED]AHK11951.1 hypothetical protein CHOED_091 [Vibrio phage CHOED]
MSQTYMTGETRAAMEAQELEAAELAYSGTPQDPEVTQDTPNVEPEATQKSFEEVQHELEVAQKRYRDLQSHHDKTKNELEGKLREAGIEPEEADKVAELQAQLAELQAKEAEREVQSVVAQAQEIVAGSHPDFVSVINSQGFAEWIKGQPQVYQDAIYADRPDAALAVDVLTLFKVQSGYGERQHQEAQRQVMDQAAMAVNGGHREAPQSDNAKVWTWSEIQKLSPHEYAKLEGEIDKALAEGRVR